MKKKLLVLSALFLCGVVVGAFIAYSQVPSQTMWITPGVYPGGYWTIWEETGNFFAKDDNGEMRFSGANATLVYNSIVALGNHTSILVKAGDLSKNIRLNINWVGNGTILRGEGCVEVETGGSGTVLFVWHENSETRNIFFHEGSLYYYSHYHSDQEGYYRFYTNFQSAGGSITSKPLYIFDGDISTENGSLDGRGMYSEFFSSWGSTFAFETLDDGAFRVYNLSSGLPTIRWGQGSIANGENNANFTHGLDGSPQGGAIFIQGQHYEICNLIPTFWNATHIRVTNYLQDGTLRAVTAIRYFWWMAIDEDGV